MAKNKLQPKKRRDPLPEHFHSYEELAAFWDTHSTADYEEYFKEVECEIDLKRRRFAVTIDSEVFTKIRRMAEGRGISTETLINLWLQEKAS